MDHSGENVYVLDFTSFKTPGRYFVAVARVGRSLPFEIGDDVYKQAFEVQAYGVFAQRCGIASGPALQPMAADRLPHQGPHPDHAAPR